MASRLPLATTLVLVALVVGAWSPAQAERLYGITIDGLLICIDPESGEGHLVADTGLSGVRGGLEVDRNGNLLTIADQNVLYRIDLDDPTMPDVVASVPGYVVVESLAFDASGTMLFGSAHASNPAVSDTFVQIDPATASVTFAAPFGSPILDVNGMASNAEDVRYGFDLDGFNFGANRRLVTIDDTGAATVVATVAASIFSLDFRSDQVLYGTQHPSNNGGAATLVTISPAGAVTSIGPVGFDDVNGIAFVEEPHDLLGVTIDGKLIEIDAATGQGKLIANTGLAQVRGGLEVDTNGDLLLTAFQNVLYRIRRSNPSVAMPVASLGPAWVGVESLSFDAARTTLYASADASNPAVSDTLITIDPSTGGAMPVGAFGAPILDVNGLAANRWDDFFAFDLDGFNGGANRRLVEVDETVPSTTTVATVPASIFSLDFSPDQVLFGTEHPSNFGGPASLVTLNTANGDLKSIGPVGFDNVNGIKWVPKPSTLLGITIDGILIRIDRHTGNGSLIADTGLSNVRGGLEVDRNGDLLTIANANELWRIDLADPENPDLVGTVSGYVVVESLAFDPCTATLYGAAHATNPAVSDTLIEISTLDGTPSAVGAFGSPIEDLNGLASTEFGEFFGFDLDGFNLGATRRLVSVDEQTGAAATVAAVPASVFSLDFSPEGTLYGTEHPSNNGGAATLVILDRQTGALTTVGPVGYSNVNGIVFAPFGPGPHVPAVPALAYGALALLLALAGSIAAGVRRVRS